MLLIAPLCSAVEMTFDKDMLSIVIIKSLREEYAAMRQRHNGTKIVAIIVSIPPQTLLLLLLYLTHS